MDNRQPYELYEDRRKYPRIVISTPVEIRVQGKSLDARIHDLSPDGLQIRCTRATLREIRPSGRAIRRENAPVVDLRFPLSIGRSRKMIEGSATLYYFVLLPGEKDGDVACGLEFRELRGRCRQDVDAFIVDAMTPVEDKVLSFLTEPRTTQEIEEHVGAGTQVLAKLLGELAGSGEVVTMEKKGRQIVHVRSAAALQYLHARTEELEKRIARLERAARRGQNE